MDFSKLPIGALMFSAAILGLFSASVLGLAPALSDRTAAMLDNAMVLVGGYWIGSSAGSAAKDAALRRVVPDA